MRELFVMIKKYRREAGFYKIMSEHADYCWNDKTNHFDFCAREFKTDLMCLKFHHNQTRRSINRRGTFLRVLSDNIACDFEFR